MVQGKKQLNSKPKFAEVVIGDNEAKEMCESDVDKKRNSAAINYKMNNDYDGNITSCLLYIQALYG